MTIDDDSRHISYYDSDDYKSDQYLTEGWYRFVTRRHMNTNCGNRYCNNYCNTQYIGWLNGDHPSVEDGVVSQKCVLVIVAVVVATTHIISRYSTVVPSMFTS